MTQSCSVSRVVVLATLLAAGFVGSSSEKQAAEPKMAASDPAGERSGRLLETESSLLDALPPEALVVRRLRIEDDFDHDGWADNGETVRVYVEVANRAGAVAAVGNEPPQPPSLPVTGVKVRLVSTDPKIACVLRSEIVVGDFAPGEARWSEQAFELVMAGEAARRTDAQTEFRATVSLILDANEYPETSPQAATFDVDLDAQGGSGSTTFFESFESGFGQFTTMHLDELLNPPPEDIGNWPLGRQASDGYRCQYSDPDWVNSIAVGTSQAPQCFPNQNGMPDSYYFRITDDRAFSGEQSLWWGVLYSLTRTTSPSQLEAIRTTEPINLGWDEASAPNLSLKHQISLADHRYLNAQPGRGAERAIVQAQLAEADGVPAGPWMRLEPYVNVYDTQANTNYYNCSFDPIDDGSTEEDFFDPEDPARMLGPSSTCFPHFSFAHQGHTQLFDPTALGDASDGPGLLGAKGPGTWVEPQFDLQQFRGRRLRLRFLVSGLKVGALLNWIPCLYLNYTCGDMDRDDGWFVDDVTVTDTLVEPAAVIVESTTNPEQGAVCEAPCTEAVAALDAEPQPSAQPGADVVLDASASTLDRCVNGVAEYRFWIDVDADGKGTVSVDPLLRDWTTEAAFLDAPFGDTRYLVELHCATDDACHDVATIDVDVTCPDAEELSGGSAATAFLANEPEARRQILFADKQRIVWPAAATVDVVRGDLDALRATGAFGPAACVVDDAVDTREVSDAIVPDPGAALYYLARSASACNLRAGGSWGSTKRDAEIAACPE